MKKYTGIFKSTANSIPRPDSSNRQALTASARVSFFSSVYDIVRQIPRCKAASYGQIACMLGSPHAARQVGWALRCCPDDLPWQRVVRADGSIAAGGEPELRRALLEAEGIPFLPDGRVDMKACRWQI